MRSRIVITIALLLCSPPAVRAAISVPSWFMATSGDSAATFSAWKNLSTREGAVYLGAGWTVLGGQLVDDEGNPMGLTRLAGSSSHLFVRGYSADLITDKDGYFLIYGPDSLSVDGTTADEHEGSWRFYATPGYPTTVMGASYAVAKKENKLAQAQLLFREADRAFYVLTVNGHTTFDEHAFESYKAETARQQLDDFGAVRAQPFRDRPRPREGSIENRVRATYKIKIVTYDGSVAAHAIVKYQAYDGYEGNSQIVETDDRGLCEVVEYLLARQDEGYYAGVQRQMTIDTPASVGPVSISLNRNAVNTITLARPAKVSGHLVDYRSDPIRMRVSVIYKRANLIAFELDVPVAPDGLFSCDRIMPGEEFRIVAGVSWQSKPRATVASNYFSLSPGEERIVDMRVPLASALRVLVVDQREQLVNAEVSLQRGEEDQALYIQPGVGKFGFPALGNQPFSIHVQAAGFHDYISDPIQLDPGELRFVRIVLTPGQSR